MKRHPQRLLGCLLAASVLSLAAFGASAQTAISVGLDTAVQAQVDVDATDPQSTAAAGKEIDRNCLRQTGTRIVSRDNRAARRCIAMNGRVYSRDDIDRTGSIDIAQALRLLDPSIR